MYVVNKFELYENVYWNFISLKIIIPKTINVRKDTYINKVVSKPN